MPQPRLTVWYNTRCPVCDAGIVRQRNKLRSLVRARVIEFRDINEEPDALAAYGASLDDIRRRLHAVDHRPSAGRRRRSNRSVAHDAGRVVDCHAARQSGCAPADALRLQPLRGCAVGVEQVEGAVVKRLVSSRNFAQAQYPGPRATSAAHDTPSGSGSRLAG
jgi:predicted DCC family thiol-disulfide oxidoreductase YuxK